MRLPIKNEWQLLRENNNFVAHVCWYFLQYFVCPFIGHTQQWSDFTWCNRCMKFNVFEGGE